MTKTRASSEYQILAIERESRRSARALIAGPGAARGVWYPVSSVQDASALVEGLNLAYFYAGQLKRSRSRSRRPLRAATGN